MCPEHCYSDIGHLNWVKKRLGIHLDAPFLLYWFCPISLPSANATKYHSVLRNSVFQFLNGFVYLLIAFCKGRNKKEEYHHSKKEVHKRCCCFPSISNYLDTNGMIYNPINLFYRKKKLVQSKRPPPFFASKAG